MRSAYLPTLMACLAIVLSVPYPAFAQSTATFTGRVIDPGGAVVPEATVTATNTGTGVVRSTTTNGDGLYIIPALEPGNYDAKAEKTGFASSERKNVPLVTNTTLTIDFSLVVAGTTQKVEVQSEAGLVETTQSEVSASLQTSEVQNLPMLNRNFTGLVQLVPGARPAPVLLSVRLIFGNGISVSGGGGRNVEVNVDGADNRDDLDGGPEQNYTIEGIQEFKLLTHEYGAQYGRTNGGVVEVATKSGTNQIHGTLFAYGRNESITAIDYFTQQSGLSKPPFDREQFGGSFGGPIKKDRLFYFGAVERIQQNSTLTFSNSTYNEAQILSQNLPSLVAIGFQPAQQISQPLHDTMYTLKADYQINAHHSLFVRWAQQLNNSIDDQFFINNIPHPDTGPLSNEYDTGNAYSMVGSETWLIGSNTVNTFMVQGNYYDIYQYCKCGNPSPVWPLRNLTFPSFSTGRVGPADDQDFYQEKIQFKDSFARQIGKHSLKLGGDFSFYPQIGITLNIGVDGAMTFFDNPSTIVGSRVAWAANPTTCTTSKFSSGSPINCGPYKQGFQTPGILSAMTLGTFLDGGPLGHTDTQGQKQVGMYVQDDWKIRPDFTLNLGLRYDLDINWYNQNQAANNRAYQALKAIGSSYAASLPSTPTHDLGPRLGFAWDIRGNGKNVLRAGAGIFFDQFLAVINFTPGLQEKPVLSIASSYVNTAVGAGQLGTYVYGVSPLPPGPPAIANLLPKGGSTAGALLNPYITDPYNEQFHIGYTRQLSSRSVISADFTHIEGIHDFRNQQINPIENAWDPTDADQHIPWGQRRFAPAFLSVLGDASILGAITAYNSQNRSTFEELIVHLEHRYSRMTFQASYTLSSAHAWGGAIAGGLGGAAGQSVPTAENQDLQFAKGEWGPTTTDERHRVVVSGVFELPWNVQVSPVFQIASARPYPLTAGADLNKDGTNNDRYIAPSTGQQLAVNAGRGSATWDWDTRVTKFFNLGKEARKLGFFAEFYDITNKANFGNIYNGNALSGASFEQPNGFLAGYPTSRQMQLGARFLF